MNRMKSWIAQGKYLSFNTGKPMLLVMDETGKTVLEPLHRKKEDVIARCCRERKERLEREGYIAITK